MAYEDTPDPAPEPAQIPATTEGSLTQAGAMALLLQFVAALGAILAVVGGAENTWLKQLYVFASSSDAVPVLGLAAMAISAGVSWFRARKRSAKLSFAFALLPNNIAQVTGPLNPKVQAAVDEAKAKASPFSRRI